VIAEPAPQSISFYARGTPQPKGSVVVQHQHGRLLPDGGCSCKQWPRPQSSAKLEEWDRLVATQARNAIRGKLPFDGAVRVSMTFYFDRPKRHTKAQRRNRYVIGKPDADKLARAVFDSMTKAAVWRDDAQAMLVAEKLYTDGLEKPGALVIVEALE
jgi:Holliday junction resolvase RusA-like endonuclease